MPSISDLANCHPNSEIYIVGTGTSMRVFPLSYLKDKITIGLNQAWKIVPVKYAITIRPELNIPEFMNEPGIDDLIWITKPEKFTNDEQRNFAADHAERFYFYHTNGKTNEAPPGQPSDAGRVPALVEQPASDFLYQFSSMSQSAAHLAANMGARTIFLVGCDNCALAENHHAHQQHTLWKGEDPEVRYRQYEEGLSEVRTALRSRGVQILNLTPFVSLRRPDEDFVNLCQELNRPIHIKNHDISATDRTCQGPRSDFISPKGRVRSFLGKLGNQMLAMGRNTAATPALTPVVPATNPQAAETPIANQWLLKGDLTWLANRTWLKPFERYLEPDRRGPLPPTRILDQRFTLVELVKSIRSLSGNTCECGVYRGVGSALICKALEGTYRDGDRHYAFDSFEGLPEPTSGDRIRSGRSVWKKGHLYCPHETVQEFLKEFPHCQIEKGWIPQTLSKVEDETFRLMHLDVDLMEPTRACLDFFYPRMVSGGLMVFDDYGSGSCRGVRAAIDEFFRDRSEQVVELVTGQAFVIKQAAASCGLSEGARHAKAA